MKKFRISYTVDVTLNASEIWPDNNAPANPTEQDVLQVIEKGGGIYQVIGDWNLNTSDATHLDVYEETGR
jgi:hypothetical protein